MEFAEAAAIIGLDDINRIYFGQDITERSITSSTSATLPNTLEYTSELEDQEQWPPWRLNVMITSSVIGTIGHLLFIAAFFSLEELKKKGYIFLICLGVTDMIITGVVMPISIVSYIYNNHSEGICQIMNVFTQAATYAYNVFFMLVAIEAYIRLTKCDGCYKLFLSMHFRLIAMFNIFLSLLISVAGVYFDMDYDYCTRNHHGYLWFRVSTAVVFYIIPLIGTYCILGITFRILRDQLIRLSRLQRYSVTDKDIIFSNLNIIFYTAFIVSWIPYAIAVTAYPDLPSRQFYPLVWIPIIRSSVTSILFCGSHKQLRLAVWNVGLYMFCKKQSSPRANRKQNKRVTYNARRQRAVIREDPPPFFL